MNWPRSRYTRSLEEQIAELKAELGEKRKTVLDLYGTIADLRLQLAVRPMALTETPATRQPLSGQSVNDKKSPVSFSGNWSRARQTLEGTDAEIEERSIPLERKSHG